MTLYTVGPTEMSARTLEVSGRQVPYFRNDEFSQVVLECERLIKKLANADDDARVIILTASGTAAMEATIMNCLDADDRALVINGGTFGRRFVQMCDLHGVDTVVVSIEDDEDLSAEKLVASNDPACSALLVNLDETSCGKLYDLDTISSFSKDNDMFLIVDAISAFGADPIDMKEAGIDVMILSSQKALALSPGLGIVVLSGRALERVHRIDPRCMYFDFEDCLKNGERGQTPFTPAVGIVYELLDRLQGIEMAGGIDSEVEKAKTLATDFRSRISGLPFDVPGFRKSNALTRIRFREPVAKRVSAYLVDRYGFVLNPCGGKLANHTLRIAHIGDLTIGDNERLVAALVDAIGAVGDPLELRQLSADDGEDVYDMLQHIGASENAFHNDVHGMSYDEYRAWLKKQDDWSRGDNLPEGYVRQWTFWLMLEDTPIGYGKLREKLTEESRKFGGTIGYAIDERHRGLGYGTVLMSRLIEMAKELGIAERMLTVEKFNYTSKAVIEKCGAKLIGENEIRWFLEA